MSNIELHFDSPWLLLLLIPAAAAVLVPWLRIPASLRSGFRRTATVIFHIIISVVLVFVLAGFSISYMPSRDITKEEEEEETAEDETEEIGGILLIADRNASADDILPLMPEELPVRVVNPLRAPTNIDVLSSYDKIMLLGVSANDLPERLAGQLAMYVQQGGSLLVSASDHSLSLGNMRNTTYETLLPVSFDYTSQSGEGIALVLVIDCSNSMTMNSGWWGGRYTDYLSLAKQGAIKSVEYMNEKDMIGIVSFNSRATLRSELVQATETQKAILSRTVSSLNTSRGTFYCDALTLAWEQLADCDMDVRHVIFLSDGEPSDYGYDDIVKDMAKDGITVSTISIGYSSYELSSMAEEGNGRYYEVSSVSDLPDIMLGETETAVSDPLVDEPAEITLKGGIPTDLPAVSAYIGTTMKDGAELILQTESRDPILARWTVGEGEAEAFMSDLLGGWTSQWLETNPGRSMLRQIFSMGISDKSSADERLTEEKDSSDRIVTQFLLPLSIILVIVLLADIAVRRLRWKDILALFQKTQTKI